MATDRPVWVRPALVTAAGSIAAAVVLAVVSTAGPLSPRRTAAEASS